MNFFWFLVLGFAASRIARRLMKHRCYSRFDDFLFATLGALVGSASAEEFGLLTYGSFFAPLMAVAGAGFLLLLSGMIVQDPSAKETFGTLTLMERTTKGQENVLRNTTTNIRETPQVSRAA